MFNGVAYKELRTIKGAKLQLDNLEEAETSDDESDLSEFADDSSEASDHEHASDSIMQGLDWLRRSLHEGGTALQRIASAPPSPASSKVGDMVALAAWAACGGAASGLAAPTTGRGS